MRIFTFKESNLTATVDIKLIINLNNQKSYAS